MELLPRQEVSHTDACSDETRIQRGTNCAQAPAMPQHGPYPPKTASLGGVPTTHVDVPVTAVFLVLFILGAIGHMTLFRMNLKRGHKFIMSGMMFGFCMARIVTCTMRIVWATRPRQIPIAIAAQVFVAAGVVLLFVINLIFAQRIIRASHPNTGWHPLFSKIFLFIYVLIVVTLVMLIVSVVQNVYTLNKNTKRVDRDIQLYGGTFNTVVAFLPILLVIGGLVIPRTTRLEKFGRGRFRIKILVLVIPSALLTLGAAFRTGTNYKTPRPLNNPAWYHSKGCFYTFNFLIEWIVIVFYLVMRVDLKFHVPNGSNKAGDYSGRSVKQLGATNSEGAFIGRVLTEDEVFDDESRNEADLELQTPPRSYHPEGK